jgi:hypothetical protein
MPIRLSKNTKSKQINLIPQDEFESSDFGRILKWALSTFRVMVIVTELVVMSAFLSRFWLDARNSDLNDEINTSKSQITAYKNVESEFRSVQDRVSIARILYIEPKLSNILSNITKLVPQDVFLTSISNTGDQIQMKASSFTEQSIAQFLINLDTDKDLKNVSLTQVSSDIENSATTLFTISAEIKK